MDKYLALEKRLAELLGREYMFEGHLGPVQRIPQWCRDWNACGPLMVEHDVYPTDTNFGYVFRHGHQLAILADHPDKDTAVRYAIVQAVVAKLEAEK